jgi:hypothetical protein
MHFQAFLRLDDYKLEVHSTAVENWDSLLLPYEQYKGKLS